MIANPSGVETLQVEWQGVIRMRERIQHLVLSTFAFDISRSPAFGDVLYNLPFLLAFDVLKQALLQAWAAGLIPGSGQRLADLIENSKSSLPWMDWDGLHAAVKRRNEVVQDGKLYGDAQCLEDISAIEAQLAAWAVIEAV